MPRFESLETILKNNPHLKVRQDNNIQKLVKPKDGTEPHYVETLLPGMTQGGALFRDILPFPPSLNMAFPTNFKTGKRYKSSRYRAWASVVKRQLKDHAAPVMKGELTVMLKLFRPKKSGDIDNYSKVVFDTLKGIVYVDDKQIVELHIFRYDDPKNPRVEIEIQEKF